MEFLSELLKPNESHFIIVLYQILIKKCNLILTKMLVAVTLCNSFSMELHRYQKCGGGTKHSSVSGLNNDTLHVNTEILSYSLGLEWLE